MWLAAGAVLIRVGQSPDHEPWQRVTALILFPVLGVVLCRAVWLNIREPGAEPHGADAHMRNAPEPCGRAQMGWGEALALWALVGWLALFTFWLWRSLFAG